MTATDKTNLPATSTAQPGTALDKPGAVDSNLAVGKNGLTFKTFEALWRFATCVQRSAMFPYIKTPEQALVAMEMGFEIGVGPIQALQNIAVINGRASIWGDLMLALVLDSGLLTGIKETQTGELEKNNLTATCIVKRKGFDDPTERTFTYHDAELSKALAKDTFKNHPKRMFQMRARAFALRDLFPDVLKGLHAREEFNEADDANVIDVAPEPAGLSPTHGRQSWKPAPAEPEAPQEAPEGQPAAESPAAASPGEPSAVE